MKMTFAGAAVTVLTVGVFAAPIGAQTIKLETYAGP